MRRRYCCATRSGTPRACALRSCTWYAPRGVGKLLSTRSHRRPARRLRAAAPTAAALTIGAIRNNCDPNILSCFFRDSSPFSPAQKERPQPLHEAASPGLVRHLYGASDRALWRTLGRAHEACVEVSLGRTRARDRVCLGARVVVRATTTQSSFMYTRLEAHATFPRTAPPLSALSIIEV